MIAGQTNVSSLREGRGSIKGIGKDVGKFVVASMKIPWDICKDHLGAKPEDVFLVESMEESILEEALSRLAPCDTVIGIGGGMAIDAAKYIAWKRGIRLVSIPTILSVDAFVTPAAGIRRNHEVFYVGESSPDPLIIDYDIVRTAPPELNIAGIGDLLSMHTACFDWEHANSKGKSEYEFSPKAIGMARQILDDLNPMLGEIRNCTDKGVWSIVEGYMRLNTICLPAGHYRVEEGSEHYLFYELEERLKRAFIHGNIVGLGIYLMSRLQNNKADEIRAVMDEVGLNYHPLSMDIRSEDLHASLLNLRNFVQQRPNLWYTCINDSNIQPDRISELIKDLKF